MPPNCVLLVSHTWGDIFYECIDSVDEINEYLDSKGCCKEHLMGIVGKLIYNYLVCRFFFSYERNSKRDYLSKDRKIVSEVFQGFEPVTAYKGECIIYIKCVMYSCK